MLQIIFGKQKKPNFFVFLKSRRDDYEISPQFRTQMGDGYGFFASVPDGVSIQHAFSLTNLVLSTSIFKEISFSKEILWLKRKI